MVAKTKVLNNNNCHFLVDYFLERNEIMMNMIRMGVECRHIGEQLVYTHVLQYVVQIWQRSLEYHSFFTKESTHKMISIDESALIIPHHFSHNKINLRQALDFQYYLLLVPITLEKDFKNYIVDNCKIYHCGTLVFTVACQFIFHEESCKNILTTSPD